MAQFTPPEVLRFHLRLESDCCEAFDNHSHLTLVPAHTGKEQQQQNVHLIMTMFSSFPQNQRLFADTELISNTCL